MFLSQIKFAARPVQEIKIIYIGKSNSEKQMIFNQTYEMDVISYWRWHQHEITYLIYNIIYFLHFHKSKLVKHFFITEEFIIHKYYTALKIKYILKLSK